MPNNVKRLDLIIMILILIASAILIFSDFGKTTVIRYECNMAEWHPDIPNDVREECRKKRYEYWKEQIDKENKRGYNQA